MRAQKSWQTQEMREGGQPAQLIQSRASLNIPGEEDACVMLHKGVHCQLQNILCIFIGNRRKGCFTNTFSSSALPFITSERHSIGRQPFPVRVLARGSSARTSRRVYALLARAAQTLAHHAHLRHRSQCPPDLIRVHVNVSYQSLIPRAKSKAFDSSDPIAARSTSVA